MRRLVAPRNNARVCCADKATVAYDLRGVDTVSAPCCSADDQARLIALYILCAKSVDVKTRTELIGMRTRPSGALASAPPVVMSVRVFVVYRPAVHLSQG